MKIGLYFGSFNPIHIGHLALSDYLLLHTNLDEVWFVVSPHNPLKQKDSLLDDNLRFQMVQLAISDKPNMKACDVEFSLPKPSYTIDTLTYLSDQYPENEFVLIIGADNLHVFNQWKNYEEIIANYKILVYPRQGFDFSLSSKHHHVECVNAPLYNISSTFIREKIKDGKDVSEFLNAEVNKYIQKNKLYR